MSGARHVRQVCQSAPSAGRRHAGLRMAAGRVEGRHGSPRPPGRRRDPRSRRPADLRAARRRSAWRSTATAPSGTSWTSPAASAASPRRSCSRGGGLEGRGEDVTYAAEDHDDYPRGAAAGGGVDDRRLLAASRRPGPVPRQAAAAGVLPSLPALGLRERRPRPGPAPAGPEPGRGARRARTRPVRFVLSTRLDIKPWLAVDPELEFKLDPTPEWDEGLDAATSPPPGASAPWTSSRSTRARPWTTRRTRRSTGS